MELPFAGFLFFLDGSDFFPERELAPCEFFGIRGVACEKSAEKVNISMTFDGDQGNDK